MEVDKTKVWMGKKTTIWKQRRKRFVQGEDNNLDAVKIKNLEADKTTIWKQRRQRFGWEEDNDLEVDKTKIWMGRRQ